MKKSILSLLLSIVFWHVTIAQDSTKTIDYSSKVASLDSIVNALYSVVSGEKGQNRDWKLFNHLFLKDAKLIPTFKTNDTLIQTRYMSPKDYEKSTNNWMVENGFFKKEIYRKTEGFGNIAHVFSTYEAYQDKANSITIMRGINSIQLLFDGSRWWIVNLYWTHETPENPIPDTYLKH